MEGKLEEVLAEEQESQRRLEELESIRTQLEGELESEKESATQQVALFAFTRL